MTETVKILEKMVDKDYKLWLHYVHLASCYSDLKRPNFYILTENSLLTSPTRNVRTGGQ